MTQPPKNRPQGRKVVSNQVQSSGPIQGKPRQQPQGRQAPSQRNNYYAPPRRDPFPIIISALLGVLVIGLLVLVYLLASNKNGTPTPLAAGAPTVGTSGGAVSAATVDTSGATAGPTPPRMPLDQFMTLYNDPAKRPLIIDLRAKEAYDAGHIAGAVSFPESDVDTRISELPKDKLIIAYCQ